MSSSNIKSETGFSQENIPSYLSYPRYITIDEKDEHAVLSVYDEKPEDRASYVIYSKANEKKGIVEYFVEQPENDLEVFFTVPLKPNDNGQAGQWNRLKHEIGSVDEKGNASPMRASLLSKLGYEGEQEKQPSSIIDKAVHYYRQGSP